MVPISPTFEQSDSYGMYLEDIIQFFFATVIDLHQFPTLYLQSSTLAFFAPLFLDPIQISVATGINPDNSGISLPVQR